MADSDFWQVMRDVRAALAAAGEDEWSQRLRAALHSSVRRGDPSEGLVACLGDLRQSRATARLGLQEQLDHLLGQVGGPE